MWVIGDYLKNLTATLEPCDHNHDNVYEHGHIDDVDDNDDVDDDDDDNVDDDDDDDDDDVQEKSKHQSPWCINTQMQLVLCEHYFEAN